MLSRRTNAPTPLFLLAAAAAAASFSSSSLSLSPVSNEAKAERTPAMRNRRSGDNSRSRRGERAYLSPAPWRHRAPAALPQAPPAACALT